MMSMEDLSEGEKISFMLAPQAGMRAFGKPAPQESPQPKNHCYTFTLSIQEKMGNLNVCVEKHLKTLNLHTLCLNFSIEVE